MDQKPRTSSPDGDKSKTGLSMAEGTEDTKIGGSEQPARITRNTSDEDEELKQAKLKAMEVGHHITADLSKSDSSTMPFGAQQNSSSEMMVPHSSPSPELSAGGNHHVSQPMAENLSIEGGLQIAPPLDQESTIDTGEYPQRVSPASKRSSKQDQEMLLAKMQAMGGYIATISKDVSAAKLQSEPRDNIALADSRPVPPTSKRPSSQDQEMLLAKMQAMGGYIATISKDVSAAELQSDPSDNQALNPTGVGTARPDGGLRLAQPMEHQFSSSPQHGNDDSHTRTVIRGNIAHEPSTRAFLASPLLGATTNIPLASITRRSARDDALAEKLRMFNGHPSVMNASGDTRRSVEGTDARGSTAGLLLAPPVHGDNGSGTEGAQPGIAHASASAAEVRKGQEFLRAGQRSGEHQASGEIQTADPNTASSIGGGDRGVQWIADHEKEGLMIDFRSAPQEHDLSRQEYFGANEDETMIDALASVGVQFSSVERSIGEATLPPTRTVRSPAEGYTVHAADKGTGEGVHTTRDGGLPGAVAVTQRAVGRHPAWSNSGNDGSLVPVQSRGELPGSTHGSSVLSTQRSPECTTGSTQVDIDPLRDDLSSIPPEMRPRRSAIMAISTWFSRTSKGIENEDDEDEDKETESGFIAQNLVCFIIVGVFLAIALGAGLAFGLGGGDSEAEEPAASSTALPSAGETSPTMTPTVDIDFSPFVSYVADLYEDPSILQDPGSPQYHALVWLASDPKNMDLTEEKIRTLYGLAVFLLQHEWARLCYVPHLGSKFGISQLDGGMLLEWPRVSSNNLVGSLPEEIGVLTGLERLLLSFNTLTSTIPSSLFKLSKLSIVDFSTNSLSGPIPESLSQATSLQTLHLGFNLFLEGPIVSSLETAFWSESSVCLLEVLVLAENVFSGTFPLDIVAAKCTNLTALNLRSSGLTGENLPSTGLKRLTILDLRQMGLTGTISESISRLSLLVDLELSFNGLEGTFPEAIGQLTALTELSLSNNQLIGAIPSSLGKLQQLATLDLRMNQLSGTLPTELAQCLNLTKAQFEGNFMSGDMDSICPLFLDGGLTSFPPIAVSTLTSSVPVVPNVSS